jgi:hypothetical protein
MIINVVIVIICLSSANHCHLRVLMSKWVRTIFGLSSSRTRPLISRRGLGRRASGALSRGLVRIKEVLASIFTVDVNDALGESLEALAALPCRTLLRWDDVDSPGRRDLPQRHSGPLSNRRARYPRPRRTHLSDPAPLGRVAHTRRTGPHLTDRLWSVRVGDASDVSLKDPLRTFTSHPSKPSGQEKQHRCDLS